MPRHLLAERTDRSCPTLPGTAACVCGSILGRSGTARHCSYSRQKGPVAPHRRRVGRGKSCPVNSRQEKRRSCQTRRGCTATASSQVSAKHVAHHGWLAKGLSNMSAWVSNLRSILLHRHCRSEK